MIKSLTSSSEHAFQISEVATLSGEHVCLFTGNLRPLLNRDFSFNQPNGDFENRMSQLWFIFKHILKNALGAPPEAAPGVFFQNVFEHEP